MNETVQVQEEEVSDFAREFGRRAVEVEDRLSSNDRRIVAHLRDHLDELPFHTADSLAVATAVSRAAIVRLARRLGYEGFAELRELARSDLKSAGQSPLARFKASGAETQLGLKLQYDRENLALTEMLSERAIARVAQRLSTARSVTVVGDGVSAGLALYFHRTLHGVRPDVHFAEACFPEALARLSHQDAVVALLFRRYSQPTIELLRRVREIGVGVVLIADGGGQRYAAESDDVLVASTESPSSQQSMVGPVFLFEALVAATAAADPERTQHLLELQGRFESDRQLPVEPLDGAGGAGGPP